MNVNNRSTVGCIQRPLSRRSNCRRSGGSRISPCLMTNGKPKECSSGGEGRRRRSKGDGRGGLS